MKKPVVFSLICSVVVIIAFALATVKTGLSQSAPPEGGYAGAEKCAMCHSAIAKGWKTTRHAKALETLKKKSQDNLPACVKCHVTGFEKDGGFVDREMTPELTGVQCESCHGPASIHAANPMNRKSLTVHPGETVCRECHTTGQDPKFDYASKKKLVHGEDPKGGKP
jgi:cytochrome c553